MYIVWLSPQEFKEAFGFAFALSTNSDSSECKNINKEKEEQQDFGTAVLLSSFHGDKRVS